MAELKDRLTDEEKLLAALLLIFADDNLRFWASGKPTPQWFVDKIQSGNIGSIVNSVVFRSAKGMLKEIDVDLGDLDEAIREADSVPDAAKVDVDLPGDDSPATDATPDPRAQRTQPYDEATTNRYRDGLLERLRVISQQYELELATRLNRIYREWLEKFEASQRAKEIPNPVVYPRHRAETEAITSTTGFITQAELITAAFVRGFLHVIVHAQWQTADDDRVCLQCAPLDQTWQGEWMKVAPNGPALHPRCRCFLAWHKEITNKTNDQNTETTADTRRPESVRG